MLSKKIKIIAITFFLLVVAIIYFQFDPELVHFFPPCPFLKLTGYQCPGCGSQRAIHSLIHLQLAKAFNYNPLFVMTLPYLLVGIYFEYFGGRGRYPQLRKTLFGQQAILFALIVIISFWIGRNIW